MLLAACAAATCTAPSALAQDHPGGGEEATVSILASAFAPDRIDVVAGDTVHWHNASVLRHTVTADDGSFGSGPLFGGDMYAQRFDAPGARAYHCIVHPGMRAAVDVHRVLLDAPREPGAPGRAFTLAGRAALPAGTAIALERDAGSGFVPAGSAVVGADGAFRATVRLAGTARVRAVAAGEASPAVRVLVVDRRVVASVGAGGRRTTVRARVVPASPGATVVLQLRLRERFGWWPVGRARLDDRSRARFAVRARRAVRARVVLTQRDGATVLARSAVFRLRPARERHPGPGRRAARPMTSGEGPPVASRR